MAKQMIVPDLDKKPAGFAPATKVGNLIFVSGQVGTGPNGLVEGVAAKQAVQCFKNLETVLKAAGASMSDVVKITAFLVRENDYKDYAEARAQAFPSDSQPASSTVIVKALAKPEFRVEVEAIAVVD